jgi:hypothetical protein
VTNADCGVRNVKSKRRNKEIEARGKRFEAMEDLRRASAYAKASSGQVRLETIKDREVGRWHDAVKRG